MSFDSTKSTVHFDSKGEPSDGPKYRVEKSEKKGISDIYVTLSREGYPASTTNAEDMALEEARKFVRDPAIDATGVGKPQFNENDGRSYVTVKVVGK